MPHFAVFRAPISRQPQHMGRYSIIRIHKKGHETRKKLNARMNKTPATGLKPTMMLNNGFNLKSKKLK